MNYLALNLLLAIVWTFLLGSFSVSGLLFGFLMGFLVLSVARPFLPSARYVRSVVGLLRFLSVYAYEIVVANIQLARDLLRPDMPFVPGFIRYDASGLTTVERVVLANMVSLTPGTLTVDYGEEGRALYIHTIYARDLEKLCHGIDLFAGLINGVTGQRPAETNDDEMVPWKL